jgi:hypothetical protein
MNPCSFQNGKNPVSKQSCQQAFTNRVAQDAAPVKMPSDPLAQVYFASLAAVGIYIVYRLMEKSK